MIGGAVLNVDASIGNLGALRAFVAETATRLGADTTAVEDLVTAVDEMATNVIRHGYRGGPGDVEVEITTDGDAFAVALRDRAPVFDPTSVPLPDVSLPLERRPLGGLGIFLARDLMDEVRHRPRPGGGNELVMRRRRTEPTAGGSDGHHDRAG